MSTYKFIVAVDVFDEDLADHDGSNTPPPNDPREWYGGDMVAAVDAGLAEIVHDELEVVSVERSDD